MNELKSMEIRSGHLEMSVVAWPFSTHFNDDNFRYGTKNACGLGTGKYYNITSHDLNAKFKSTNMLAIAIWDS